MTLNPISATTTLLRRRGHDAGQVAVGIGRYGFPAVCDLDTLKLPALVLGGPRTGKTRLANSMNAQQVRVTGGGACIIDFKGGDDIPSYWAEVAQQENRAFHHFTLNEKSSGAYRRPHPYARTQPSFYDPLVRGNGDSKTAMLLNSVDRDGDAAAYLRTAEDVVMLAFDIADLTGFSAGKGGLETLTAILDPAALDKAANQLTVDAVLRAHPSMADVDARRRVNDLQQRVAEMGQKTRGAGNLLGGEQSGHIAGVGFDLYVRMVGEAVADYRAALEEGGEAVEEPPLEVKIELPVDAHVPHDYAPGERLRLQAYRAIAEAGSEEDIAAVREELTDRYGPLPEPVENLLLVAGLRMLARSFGVADITLQGSNIRFAPVELRESQELRLKRLYPRSVVKAASRQVLVPRPTTARIGGKPVVGRELLAWVGEFLTGVLS